MKIADEEALSKGLSLTVLEDVCAKFKELESKGMGDLGTQAIIEYYKK